VPEVDSAAYQVEGKRWALVTNILAGWQC